MTPLDRFNAKWVEDPTTGCWLWTARRDKDGYGQIKVQQKHWSAHRFSYTQFVGKIPEGLLIDHRCRNHACVNPQHLRVVTHQVNTIENSLSIQAMNARKTHCPQGHPYDETNTYHHPRGHRICRSCSRVSALGRYYRNKK